ncbi:glycosyl transferase, partial [Escherichia coli O157:H7]|nr:glycosyl transferase [Escherichia coli O157:H7]
REHLHLSFPKTLYYFLLYASNGVMKKITHSLLRRKETKK